MLFNYLIFIYYLLFFLFFYFSFYIFFLKNHKEKFYSIYLNQKLKEINNYSISFDFFNKIRFYKSNKKIFSKSNWLKLKKIKIYFDDKYIYFESYLGDFKRVNKISQIKKITDIKKTKLLLNFKSEKNLPLIIKFKNKKELKLFFLKFSDNTNLFT
jgi:hypothetical protein